DAPGVRIEDVATDILPILWLEVAHQHEADDRLAMPLVGTACAAGAAVITRGARLDTPVVKAVGLEDANQAERPAGAVERLPQADGRGEPRVGPAGRQRRRGE